MPADRAAQPHAQPRAPAGSAAAAAPLEPPPSPQQGPRTRGGRLRPSIPLAATVAAFALLWLLSQTWTVADDAVATWVAEHVDPGQQADWRTASWPGATLTAFILGGAGAAGALLVREWRAGAVVAIVSVASGLLVHGLKLAIGRDRPTGAVLDTYAFPSGHATTVVVAWGLLVLVALPAVARHMHVTPLARRFALGLWLGIAATTGLCRILGGAHWTSDVLGGFALGGALLVISVRLARTDRPPPRLPAA